MEFALIVVAGTSVVAAGMLPVIFLLRHPGKKRQAPAPAVLLRFVRGVAGVGRLHQ